MTWKLLPCIIVTLAALGGCATGASSGASSDSGTSDPTACTSEMAETAVGQKVSPDLVEQYRKKSNAKLARALRPNDVITMEYNPQRLNLRVDEQDIVISVNCS